MEGSARDRNGLLAGEEWDATTQSLHDAKAKRPTLVYLPPVQRIEILLQGVSYFVPATTGPPHTRNKRRVQLLNNIDCHFKSGELVALMSASGAGKSTLLNLLAMRTPHYAQVEGRVLVNGEPMTRDFQLITSLMPQDDVMFGYLRVGEQVRFQAALRLPRDMTGEERVRRIRATLDRLSISACKENLIGGPGYRHSVSGGERKRTSVASELVTNPAVVFLDEPISGLDAHNAYAVVSLLRELVHEGRLVICSIHQPSVEVFELFDKVLLLAKAMHSNDGTGGNMAFFGSLPDAEKFFAHIGHPVPPRTNPASWYINVITPIMETSHDGTKLVTKNQEGIKAVVAAFEDWGRTKLREHVSQRSVHSLADMGEFHIVPPNTISAWHQLVILLHLHGLLLLRNPRTSVMRIAQGIVLSILCGLIYLQLGFDQTGLQNRQGALFFLMMQTFMGCLMSVINVLPTDRPVFIREVQNHSYGAFPYWLARSCIEFMFDCVLSFAYGLIAYFMVGFQAARYGVFLITMLLLASAASSVGLAISSGVRDVQTAILIASVCLVPLLLFGGFFINTASLPVYLAWLRFVTPYYYAYPTLMSNELSGLMFYCTPSQLVPSASGPTCPFTTGDQYLAYVGLSSVDNLFNLGMLAVLIVGYRAISAFIFLIAAKRIN